MIKKHFSALIKIAIFSVVLLLAHLAKFNIIWGSCRAFFSASQIVGPLAGLYGGFVSIALLYFVKDLIKGLFFGSSLLSPLSFHIPTFFSGAYWASNSFIVRFFVPAFCIILFLIHPVGSQAWFYTLYWLIPLVIYMMPRKMVFFDALASTFIAHAVGSVIWLYWLPLKPELFWALMPIVILERILFASGMTLTYCLIENAKRWLLTYKLFFSNFNKNICTIDYN
jgi:hypothetical protein